MRALLPGLLLLSAPAASAYTISAGPVDGCHERMTQDALRIVRQELSTAQPIDASADERALIDDLEFIPPADMRDLAAATLLMAVRDNDLKGRGATDLSQLAEVHGSHDAQEEHCLRGPTNVEPSGTEEALAACVDFMRMRVTEALDGLDSSGGVDATIRVPFTVTLALRGRVDPQLPVFYVRMGQALHALQDSYTHTFRTADTKQVTVALNWVAFAEKRLEETRDGPPHSPELDRCDDPDELRKTRRELATQASTELLRLGLEPAWDRATKLVALESLLHSHVSYAPGCSADNGWCSADEAQLGTRKPGCTATPGIPLFAVLTIALLRMRRRLLLLGVLLGITLTSTPALATEEDDLNSIGVHLGASGALERPAIAGNLGIRLRVSRHWAFGLDGEWNPWLALAGRPIRPGVLNIYASAILRIPLRSERFNLRTQLSAGSSTLLIALYGAPAWSTGLYAALLPLGIEWKIAPHLYFVLHPLSIAIAAPQLVGLPLVYPQYRLSIGVELDSHH